MSDFRIHIAAVIAPLFLLFQVAEAFPKRPEPPRLVNDFASVFTREQADSLEQMLVAFDDSTSNQITVVTVKDLEGYDVSEYAVKIGIDWEVGAKNFNNGVVLLVKPKTFDSGGKVSIQVGYGLEEAITDAYARIIIENDIIPHFKENDYYGGVQAGLTELMDLASGVISKPRSDESLDEDISALLAAGLFIIFIICVVIWGIKSEKDDSSGGDSFGGGLSGGVPFIGHSSGRSSGGSSFGGFGGGSFGGGGASGGW